MEYGYVAEINSSLLIINPFIPEIAERRLSVPPTTYYFIWTGEKFKLIGAYIITKDSIQVKPNIEKTSI